MLRKAQQTKTKQTNKLDSFTQLLLENTKSEPTYISTTYIPADKDQFTADMVIIIYVTGGLV